MNLFGLHIKIILVDFQCYRVYTIGTSVVLYHSIQLVHAIILVVTFLQDGCLYDILLVSVRFVLSILQDMTKQRIFWIDEIMNVRVSNVCSMFLFWDLLYCPPVRFPRAGRSFLVLFFGMGLQIVHRHGTDRILIGC